MSALDTSRLLRPGLLAGTAMLVAHGELAPSRETLGGAVARGCAQLGAGISVCEAHATDEAAMDEAVRAALIEHASIDMLVLDGASLFARGLAEVDVDAETDADADAEVEAGRRVGAGGHEALRACLDTAWNVTRAVINHAFLPEGHGGRVVYLAPAPDAGEFAEAARAGLENLSRTLSIEWARHGVNVLCIAPGVSTAAGEVASICAYLASPAGEYFSGCLLDLRGV